MSNGVNSTWKVVIVFAGIFLAGAVTGGFVAPRMIRSYVQQRGTPDQFPATHMMRLNEVLKLSDQQKVRISEIVGAAGEELRQLRKDTDRCFTAMNGKIVAELTPEQKLKFEEMQRRWRERMKTRSLNLRPDREPGKREDRKFPPLEAPVKAGPPPERP